ncbi:MAG: MFS transporter [Candidatus Omnitrophota bacterium]
MNASNSRISRSLRFSFLDGTFASAMTGFTQEYFTPFLLLLGASVTHIGILNALPNFFASLIQLKSADLVERVKSRKKIINTFVFLQALMLVPMAIIAWLIKVEPVVFIGFVILFSAFGAFATPAWGSLMSDLVEEDKRGEYFGFRNSALGFISVGVAFAAGIILHMMKKINVFYGFVIIFGLAFIFRIISWYFLTRMYEPPLSYHKENYFTLVNFLARIKESNFARFVLFIAMMNFSVNLASPFFAVLMLRDLQFSYFLYTAVTVTATLAVYSLLGRWGRHADKVGNLKVLKLTGSLIGIIPLLWILNRHPVFLFFAQIFSGFVWAGFNLCATNFIYDAVTPQKRARCISYFNVLNGFALCAGALLGGFLIQKLPPIHGHKILTLFLISSVLRIAVALIMPVKLKEVRPVERIKSIQLFFSITGIKPLLGVERKTIRI